MCVILPKGMGRLNRLARMSVVFLLLGHLAGGAQAAGFLSTIDDMPLADGVVEIEDGAMVFDKPAGRIVQVTALRDGDVAVADIRRFYADTLPNLGWRPVTLEDQGLTFARKGETLRITLTADLVIFDLAPRP